MPTKYSNEEVYSVLRNMKRKTRRERDVRTNPECQKESGSHKKSTRKLYTGIKRKEMRSPVAPKTGAISGISHSHAQTTTNHPRGDVS